MLTKAREIVLGFKSSLRCTGNRLRGRFRLRSPGGLSTGSTRTVRHRTGKLMTVSLSVHRELEKGVGAMNALSNTKPRGCGELMKK